MEEEKSIKTYIYIWGKKIKNRSVKKLKLFIKEKKNDIQKRM